ncbi:MAG: hypothetical protein GPJ52_02765 [Candidatus Heimdallarchaeota archaeon]|nr:hypothetical protein [Candidatus Heimdallarchaeota archaeon]
MTKNVEYTESVQTRVGKEPLERLEELVLEMYGKLGQFKTYETTRAVISHHAVMEKELEQKKKNQD